MNFCNFEKEGDMGKYHAVQEKHWRMWEKAEHFEKAAEILEQISKVCEEKGDGQKKKEATSALIRMLSNPSTIDGLSNDLLSVLRSALEASVVSDGNDASVQNQVCIPLQVDPSRCSLGCLDIKTKVVFQYMLLIRVILKRNLCFDVETT